MNRSGTALWLGTLCALTLSAAPKQNDQGNFCTETAPRPMRVAARYTSPNGIGYKPGYTTLEGFFSWMCHDKWVPFLDVRAHVLDNGRFASNVGLGGRYLTHSRIWGINTYYDFRRTDHRSYNQVAVGFESLGKMWDFRLNGYLPVGAKHSSLRHVRFDEFKDHFMYLRSVRDFVLAGANFEAGVHVDSFKDVPLYFAAGPYYLTGRGATAWGGEFRVALDFFHRHLRIEGNTSYDHFFKWIGQGQVSLNYSFGGKRKVERHGRTCAQEKMLYTRAVQRVDRAEIIPVGKQHLHKKAINPATGEPFFFLFVNNTSHSLGTYESPYPTLFEAQSVSSPGNIIYVFSGDGSSTGMNLGINLQDSQMLLGASTQHPISTTWGTVFTPVLSSILPVVTNTSMAPVITLNSNNTVSGIYINNVNGAAIAGSNLTNFTATQNTIIGGSNGDAVLLTDISGQVAITNNNFFQTNSTATEEACVHIQQTSAQCSANFANNTFFSIPASSGYQDGIFADLSGTGSIGSLNIDNCNFYCTNTHGYAVHAALAMNSSSSIGNMTVSNSTTQNFEYGIEVDIEGSGPIADLTVSNCTINGGGITYAGIYVNVVNSGFINNFTVTDSTVANVLDYGIIPSVFGNGFITNINMDNCNITGNGYGYYPVLGNNGVITNMTLSNSTMSNSPFGYGFVAQLNNNSSISNFTASNCTFSNNTNTGDAYGINLSLMDSSSISNFTLSDCTISGNVGGSAGYGIYIDLEDTSSISNLTVSDTNLSNHNTTGIELINNSSNLLNCTLTNCSLSSSNKGVTLAGSGSIGTFSVDGCSFNQIAVEGINVVNNALSVLNITGSTFTANEYAVYLGNTTTTQVNTSNSTFSGNQFGMYFDAGNGPSAAISNNTFNLTQYQAVAIGVNGSNVVSVANNTFTGVLNPAPGYAVYVISSGSMCLDLFQNQASPTTMGGSNTPYSLTNASGTFNLTPESTQANNTGTITFPASYGSCSQ